MNQLAYITPLFPSCQPLLKKNFFPSLRRFFSLHQFYNFFSYKIFKKIFSVPMSEKYMAKKILRKNFLRRFFLDMDEPQRLQAITQKNQIALKILFTCSKIGNTFFISSCESLSDG